jgi:hypothetical protein
MASHLPVAASVPRGKMRAEVAVANALLTII